MTLDAGCFYAECYYLISITIKCKIITIMTRDAGYFMLSVVWPFFTLMEPFTVSCLTN